MRRAALDMGVQVFEDTPVRAVSEEPGSAAVRTAGGEVRADGVVLAINAWMAGFPAVRRRMVVTASDNLVTRALPDALLEQAGLDGIGVSDSTRLLNYWRTTGDGGLLFGKGGVGLGFGARGADSMFGPIVKGTPLGRELSRILPMANRAGVRDTWRAPVEYSLTSLPFFEALPGHQRVFYGAGYSGDGVGPARLGGKILASLVLREQDGWSRCGLLRPPQGWLPPEPFRFLGGQLVKSALLRIEGAENAGRTPHPLARTLSRLDPTSWV
jgi:glycine/D-amino acid oxidase-like deaminating enzyme